MKILKSGNIVVMLLGVFLLASCSKSLDEQSDVEAAFVKVVHAAPQTTALDIAFDNDRLYLNFFSYTNHTSYIPVTTGINAFYVFRGNAGNPSVSKNLNFEARKNYSVFIVDTASKMDAVLVRDSSRAPGGDSVRLRFANMSPDAGGLDLYIQGTTTPVATNVSYKSAGDFMSLKAVNDVVFELRAPGQATVLATSENINLVTGNFYTIWSTGFKLSTSEDGKMRLGAIRH